MLYRDDSLKRLIGKWVKGILLDADEQHYLGFETDQGEIWFYAEGDCCSESWFADIINPGGVIGHQITDARMMGELNLGDSSRSRQECDWWYGVSIESQGGACLVAFRNSSNGYYGGRLADAERPTDRALMNVIDDWAA